MEINKIYNGDSIEVLKSFPDNSIDCCITSPPYFGLRDYGTAKWEGGLVDCDHIEPQGVRNPETSGKQLSSVGTTIIQYKNICKKCNATRIDEQIGLEETPELYVAKMVEVFTEVKRVLKKEGTLWLNLGDTYSAHKDCKSVSDSLRVGGKSEYANIIEKGKSNSRNTKLLKSVGLKNKDLIGIPWMVAFALRSSGWYLRQDIIWHKPNPMPESVTDRCTKAHEYIFLLSKSAKYYYDAEAIKQIIADASMQRLSQDIENQKGSERVPGKTNGNMKDLLRNHKNMVSKGKQVHSMHKARLGLLGSGFAGHSGNYDANGEVIGNGKANKRSVWTVTTKPFSEAHFATFPEDLIVDMIKAGCPEGGIVLDCFMGAGTTALVAAKLNRNYAGIELNPEYVRLAENRLKKDLGMFHPLAIKTL